MGERGILVSLEVGMYHMMCHRNYYGVLVRFFKRFSLCKTVALLDLYYKHQEKLENKWTIVRLTEDSAVCPIPRRKSLYFFVSQFRHLATRKTDRYKEKYRVRVRKDERKLPYVDEGQSSYEKAYQVLN